MSESAPASAVQNKSHRAYYPAIDGLRAVAVLVVILFHYNVSLFRGGFVGVDVFFVISGYLISSLIIAELDDGQFSILRFYERRARRILPALFTVSLVSAAAAWAFFFPADLIEFGKSFAATALFISNVFFWSVSGYFAIAIKEKPLLHTWSLGIEEQFYLFFPLLLTGAYRIGRDRAMLAAIALTALASFVASVYAAWHWPDAAFYLLPFRFWELAVGGLLAACPLPKLKRLWIYDAMASVGLLMILVAATSYSKHTFFPGVTALLPCCGALLVILAKGEARIGNWILRTRPVNFTGRLSYSLYLWHWPLQAFLQYRIGDVLAGKGFEPWLWRAGALAVCFFLSWLSWRLIEQPFRRPEFLSRRHVFLLALSALGIMAGLGAALFHGQGFPQRFPPAALAMAAESDARIMPPFNLCPDKIVNGVVPPACLTGDLSARPVTVALWGDSHAGALGPAFDALLRQNHLKGIEFIRSSCPAFAGAFHESDPLFSPCPAFDKAVMDYIRSHPDIQYIFLAGRWAGHPGELTFNGSKQDAFYKSLAAAVHDLKQMQRRVLIVASVPEIDFNVPRCLSKQLAFGSRFFQCGSLPMQKYTDHQAIVMNAFNRLNVGAAVYQPSDAMCPAGQCLVSQGGHSLYVDDNHLSTRGAMLLLPGLSESFGKIVQQNR